MTDNEAEYLERAVRAEAALRTIHAFCVASLFGGWRFTIAAMVKKGLGQ